MKAFILRFGPVICIHCCFQILILLVAIGQQKKHGHVVLVQTHVESLRVTVMETRTALETSHADLIIVLISSQKGLIAVMNLKHLCNHSMLTHNIWQNPPLHCLTDQNGMYINKIEWIKDSDRRKGCPNMCKSGQFEILNSSNLDIS